jgi:hypothetical protein
VSETGIEVGEAISILASTPSTLRALLSDLPGRVIHQEAADGGWSPYDVLGHLIHGEKTDWMPRARMILKVGEGRAFEPFDRFAQFRDSRGKSLSDLLDEFEARRAANLEDLRTLASTNPDLGAHGRHPELGPVTLGQLLATWTVHDLNHLAQIARAIAGHYTDQVGPWREYLPILG